MRDGEQYVRGATLGLLAVAYHFLTICLHFPYQLLTLSLPVAYYLLHVQDGEQNVMDLVFSEHVMEFPPPRAGINFYYSVGVYYSVFGGLVRGCPGLLILWPSLI